MNPEFAWSIIVIFIALVLGAVAIGMYFYLKEEKEYDTNYKHIVWSIAISGGVILVFGILLMIWAIHKSETVDALVK